MARFLCYREHSHTSHHQLQQVLYFIWARLAGVPIQNLGRRVSLSSQPSLVDIQQFLLNDIIVICFCFLPGPPTVEEGGIDLEDELQDWQILASTHEAIHLL